MKFINRIFPKAIKDLFRVPYYYRAEVEHRTIIITEDVNFDVSKYDATSVSFVVPENTGTIIYDTVKIKSIPLASGDPMRKFQSEIPHVDRSTYEIAFNGITGTEKALYVYLTIVTSYSAIKPNDVIPCE